MSIGAAVRQAREEAGVPQQELARLAGLSQARVSDIENAKNGYEPTLAQVVAIEDALGLRRGDILRRAGWFTSDEEAEQYAAAAGELISEIDEDDRDLAFAFLRQLRDRGRARRQG